VSERGIARGIARGVARGRAQGAGRGASCKGVSGLGRGGDAAYLPFIEEASGHGAEERDVRRQEGLDAAVVEEEAVREQLHQDASQRPEVDLGRVRVAEDDLGGAVGAALDVGAPLVVVEVGVAVVDDFDLAHGEARDQDVLGLEVAVDDVARVEHRQCLEALARDLT
jgi:hypothetical protein